MKKLNLIKRLLSYSHEKQSPQRFARYAAMLIMLLTLGIGQMWGATETTVYYAISKSDVGNYNVKCNVNRKGDGDDWATYNMVSNGRTDASGRIIYTCTFTDLYDGLGKMQFQLYDGETWKSQEDPISSWTSASTYNGKMRVKGGSSWTTYSPSGYAYYVTGDQAAGWLSLDWNTTADTYKMSGTTTQSITISSVSAASHKLKVSTYNWGSSWGHSEYSAATHHNVYSESDDGGNILFTPAMAGDVTISFNTSTSKISIVCAAPTITFDMEGGSGGASSQNTYYNEATSSITVPTKTGYDFGGYYDGDNGTGIQIINASGVWQKDKSGFTDNSATAKWIVRANHTLYAKWTPKSYSITYKDKGGSAYSGSNEASLPSSYTYGTGIASLTDGVKSGYRFDGWFDNSDCTGSAVTSISSSATGEKTFYAKWTENPGGTVTLTAGTGGQVSKNGSSWGASTSYSGIKSATPLNIYAQANTGYTFSSWSKTSGAGTITSTSTANTTFTPVADADAALTASFTETMSSLSTSCSYDAGNPSYAAPIVSGSATNVGYVTTRTITATAAGTGYTFSGWTLTNCTRTDGGAPTATSITIRSNGDGAAVSVVANYEEDLSSDWHLLGATTPFGGWSSSASNMLQKPSGSSTGSIANCTISVSALPSAEEYTFKLYNSNTDKWRTNNGYWVTRANNNPTLDTEGGNNNELIFKPDIAGDYIFSLNYSGSNPVLTVTFPTSYTLTYSIGSVAGNNGSISTSPSTASGSKVLSGSNITLTAPEPAPGYSWSGWYTNAAGTEGNIADENRAITVPMNADKTLYACYTEDMHDVTVNVTGNGTVSYGTGAAGISCTASAGIATASNTIHAIPAVGYAFVGWTGVSAEEDNNITGYTATWNSTNEGWDLTVKADAATTIVANFAPRFALVGAISADGDPDGGMPTPAWDKKSAAAFTYSAGTYTYTLTRELTSPNTTYKFQIVDRRTKDWDLRGYTEASNNLAVDNSTTYTLSGTNNVYFDSRGIGNYTFTIVEETIDGVKYPKVKIQDGANSHMITWGYVSDNEQDGGTITYVVDGEATPNAIASGKYVKDGGSITATASANTGYRFVDFRTSSTYGGGSQLSTSNPYTVASVEADQNIYAQFAENKCTVTITANDKTKGSITVGDEAFAWDGTTEVGVYTNKSLVVTPAEGYYFSGWTLSNTPDFAVGNTGESGASTDLTGLGGTHGSTGTLTANFTELDKIYFRNLSTMEGGAWANVYVYFGVTWNGYDNAVSNSNAAYKVAMTQIGSSDVYWAYVPRSFTTSAGTAIAFSNQSVGTGAAINTGEAATRNDYNKALQMYIPSVAWVDHGAHYHNDGYWKNYPVKAATGAGYYLQTTRGVNLVEFTGQADNLDIIECIVRVDQSDEDKTFHIISAGGIYFEQYDYVEKTYPKITSTASTMTMKSDDTDGLIVTLTSEGNYKFILDQSSDVMVLTVVYPIGVGDYRIKHSYSDSGTKYAYSDIIKSSDSHPTVSMYYNPSSATMVLQKCTLVNTSGPKWDEGTAIDRTKLNKGAGVYQFDLTIADNAGTIDDGAGLYDGPFYIKTDCAPGSWANYTQNVMDKNTINPTAFDYYFMKWLDLDTDNNEKKNIKCVIANQYNNAISDTLKSDGIATMVDGEPVLDNDGSVRFSYNSKTNALERAYLTGASNLTLESNVQYKIYDYSDGTTDLYDRHPGFVDDVVWTYEITVKAKLGAQAGVRADWTNKGGTHHYQTLIANTNPIISGTGDGTYTIRILFDFKTNSITSTWKPSGDITDKLSDVDVMLVREGQAASNVITFGEGGTLAPRKLVGSLKFTKTNYEGKVSAWNSTTRPLLMFFVSFPFDVKVNDIFGLNGAYGSAYVIRRYAGEKRAEKGFFRGDGTTSFWEDLTLDSVMHAYQGYIVVLDNDYFNSNAYGIWGDKSEQYLYFPSVTPGTIVSGETTIKVPSHECTLTNSWTEGGKTLYHSNTDSHWNLIGVPVFTTITGNSGTAGSIANVLDGSDFHYFYQWNSGTNDFSVGTANGYSFNAMHGYMVQYCGDITFTGSVFTPSSVAARRTPMTENYNIELQVLDNDAEMLNHTYVELRENAHTDFELNEDVYLSPNNRAAEIYSFAGDYDVAANVLPIENQTVQVGLNVHKAGTYTIAMPSNFSGTATLIDTYNNTRTNLAIDDYEVALPKGACNDRFLLDINIHKVPTAIDGVDVSSLKDGKAHKYIENDQMYILKNGTIYNAQGAKVK